MDSAGPAWATDESTRRRARGASCAQTTPLEGLAYCSKWCCYTRTAAHAYCCRRAPARTRRCPCASGRCVRPPPGRPSQRGTTSASAAQWNLAGRGAGRRASVSIPSCRSRAGSPRLARPRTARATRVRVSAQKQLAVVGGQLKDARCVHPRQDCVGTCGMIEFGCMTVFLPKRETVERKLGDALSGSRTPMCGCCSCAS